MSSLMDDSSSMMMVSDTSSCSPSRGSTRPLYFQRLNRDVADLLAHDFTCSSSCMTVSEGDHVLSLKLNVCVFEGAYKNGHFSFLLDIPEKYPFTMVEVWSKHPIWHPNVDLQTGRVHLPLVWSPILTLNSLALAVQMMLLEPSVCTPCMNVEASTYCSRDPQTFEQYVQRTLMGYQVGGVDFPLLSGPECDCCRRTRSFSRSINGISSTSSSSSSSSSSSNRLLLQHGSSSSHDNGSSNTSGSNLYSYGGGGGGSGIVLGGDKRDYPRYPYYPPLDNNGNTTSSSGGDNSDNGGSINTSNTHQTSSSVSTLGGFFHGEEAITHTFHRPPIITTGMITQHHLQQEFVAEKQEVSSEIIRGAIAKRCRSDQYNDDDDDDDDDDDVPSHQLSSLYYPSTHVLLPSPISSPMRQDLSPSKSPQQQQQQQQHGSQPCRKKIRGGLYSGGQGIRGSFDELSIEKDRTVLGNSSLTLP